MLDPAAAMTRMMAVAFGLAEIGLKTAEMMTASGVVIGARVSLMAAATQTPHRAAHREFARMLPEKVNAFSSAGAALIDGWWAAQSDLGNYLHEVGRTAMSGRVPTVGDLASLVDRTSRHGTDIAARTVSTATSALDPFHHGATANARRLARRKQGF